MNHEQTRKVNNMKTYTHNEGETITQSEVEEPLKVALNNLIDGDNALHNIIYTVIDGESLFEQGVDAAFMAMEKARWGKPEFSALNKASVINEAVNYARFFISLKGMDIARGLQ